LVFSGANGRKAIMTTITATIRSSRGSSQPPSKSPIPGEPTRTHVRTAARALAGEYRQRLDLSGRNGLELALGAEQVRWLTLRLWSRVIDIGPLEKTRLLI